MGDYWVPTRSDVQVTDPAIKGFVTGAQNGYPIPQAAWFNNWEGPFQEMINEELNDQFTVFDAVRLACNKMDTLNNK
jgi:maltose-binding protein MalE